MKHVVGDVFVSAACVNYYGPFTGQYRESLTRGWLEQVSEQKIALAEDWSLAKTFGSDIELRGWQINGLPTDEVSSDSAVLMKTCHRWPLIIDPQEQANQWLKNEYKKLIILRFGQRDFLKHVCEAIKTGSTVLIEELGERVDGSINPLLLRQTFVKGGDLLIRLGEQDVLYNPAFQLYMTTKLANPHYLPDVCIKVTLLNFTVTRKGLEDQLLGEVVRKEQAEVEAKRTRLVVSMASDRRQLDEIEGKILSKIGTVQGNILDDQKLIDTLDEARETGKIIKERMGEKIENERIVNEVREKYRPVAQRGSILYFVIAQLALADPMYQYSLSYFMRLFNLCVDQAEPSEDLDTRLKNLISYLTFNVSTSIQRGLFETHKLMFNFLITVEVQRAEGKVTQNELNLLLRAASNLTGKSKKEQLNARQRMPNPDSSILSDPVWQGVLALEDGIPEVFKELANSVAISLPKWTVWLKCADPVQEALPGTWDSTLTPFQRLLVVKCFRKEHVVSGMAHYVTTQMGAKFAVSVQTSLEDVYKDMDSKTPAVFVLSQGADPTQMLFRFAQEQKFSDRLNVISLGQGQGENAKRMVEQAQRKGQWVLLQNCHLAKSWMPELEKLVESFTEDDAKVHASFRLWLTSMPRDYFPVTVLQKSIKVTNEPPKGLRANLLRSYTAVLDAHEFEACSKPQEWKKLLFGLCFFHAVIQERKKFGALGWNKQYEFNDSDLETSIQVLHMFLEEQPEVPWVALRYVIGQINYGGRVTDDWDRRCLNEILSGLFKPDILVDTFKFSTSGLYFAPQEGKLDSYVEYLEKLPLRARPEVFGMHANADITFQRKESETMLNTVLALQPRLVTGTAGSTDQVVSGLALELEEKMPSLLDVKKAGPDTFELDENKVMSSLSTVLSQELQRFNTLLQAIKRSLIALQRAIVGEVLMDAELDRMYTSLLNNVVPQLWSDVAYPSRKPLASWVADLHKRVEFLRSWLTQGQPNSFWLSGFFFPQGFITGTLQTHARRYKIPIDSLSFAFKVMPWRQLQEVEHPPVDGVYVHGLFLDGARWDEKSLALAESKPGILFSKVPVIHFLPTKNYKKAETDYECPTYKTSVRAGMLSTTGHSTNFVLPVHLPTPSQSPEHWVRQGVALLCQLDT